MHLTGIYILMNAELVKNIKAYHEVNGRLFGIDMMVGDLKFRILSVYITTQKYDISAIEEVYERMNLLVRSGR